MGYGIKIGGHTVFKAFLRIQANAGITVTVSGPDPKSGTVPSSGILEFEVRKKGSYTVTSGDGASTSVTVETRGYTYNIDVILESYISVTANPNITVTASLGTYSQSGTTDSSGKATIAVSRLGNYTVTTADGASGTVNVLADGSTYSINVVFSATVTITANPSATITLTKSDNSNITYSGSATTAGVCKITVKYKGTFDVSTNNNASYGAEGNTSSVTVSANDGSYTGQFVKLNIPASIAVSPYRTNALCVYWTKPSAHWTGCNIRYNENSTTAPASRTAGTDLATGAGETVRTANYTAVNGYAKTGLNTSYNYAFAAFSYITINNVSYWCATSRTATGKPANYVGATQTITASNASWKVPNGWYKLRACIVGGGGAGGNAGASSATAGGGGGGGFVNNTGDISVTPGQSIVVTVGNGGSPNSVIKGRGGTGEASSFGSYTANGGMGGKGSGSIADNGNYEYGGGKGGSGGGSAGKNVTSLIRPRSGGNGGSNGGSGETMTTSSYGTSTWYYFGGEGQGTTTKAFGDGTAYAGGGGGGMGGSLSQSGVTIAVGGSYGGGNGGSYNSGTYTAPGNGTKNSGGGGGGYSEVGSDGVALAKGGSGGSGIIIVKCVA